MTDTAPLRLVTLEPAEPRGDGLTDLCRGVADVAVIARCARAGQLARALTDARPDVLLLDTDVCSDADLAGVLPLDGLPVTIVVSASRSFASQAFDLGVVDYLTRPVNPGRLQRALARARERVCAIHALRFCQGLPRAPEESATLNRMTVEKDGRLRFLSTEEIQSIVSCRNYVVVHDAAESHIFRSTLKRVEQQLAGQWFLRIERSVLLNLRFVVDVQRMPQRRFRFRMRNGRTHLSGASHYAAIVAYLRQCQPYMEFTRARRASRSRAAGNIASGA